VYERRKNEKGKEIETECRHTRLTLITLKEDGVILLLLLLLLFDSNRKSSHSNKQLLSEAQITSVFT